MLPKARKVLAAALISIATVTLSCQTQDDARCQAIVAEARKLLSEHKFDESLKVVRSLHKEEGIPASCLAAANQIGSQAENGKRDLDLLTRARELAEKGEYVTAIDLVFQFPPTSPLYPDVLALRSKYAAKANKAGNKGRLPESHSDSVATNDAELLLSRCGRPSADDSTEFDKPRPPIPSRIIEYHRVGLRIAFVPGGGAKLGDPPPYKWKLMGVIDIKRNEAITLSEALGRMPCWSRQKAP